MSVDDEVRRLLHDAVDDIEPAQRLGAIRDRVRSGKPGRGHGRLEGSGVRRRGGWLVAGGAVIASAAAVTAIAVVPALVTDRGDDRGPAEPGRSTTSSVGPAPQTLGIYFVGDTARGAGLYREFQSLSVDDPLTAAVDRAISGSSLDADYRSHWPSSVDVEASYDGDRITVDLSGPELRERPSSLSRREAELAVEQVVYTAQAVEQDSQAPVQLLIDGKHSDQVLGVPAAEPLARAPELDTRAHVNLSQPSDGATVRNRLHVEGVAASFEGNVPWQITDSGGTPVTDGYFTANAPSRLSPFEGTLDVSGLSPGTYELAVETENPGSGTEASEPDIDTRTFVVSR